MRADTGLAHKETHTMTDVILKGVALKAAVAAAENPVSGKLVARNLIAQLGLDSLSAIDLREVGDPPPASLPHQSPRHNAELEVEREG